MKISKHCTRRILTTATSRTETQAWVSPQQHEEHTNCSHPSKHKVFQIDNIHQQKQYICFRRFYQKHICAYQKNLNMWIPLCGGQTVTILTNVPGTRTNNRIRVMWFLGSAQMCLWSAFKYMSWSLQTHMLVHKHGNCPYTTTRSKW